MKGEKREISSNAATELLRTTSLKDLSTSIFKGDITEDVIRSLPAQIIYMVIQTIGIESSADLISACAPSQYKAFLDFELWSKDQFEEERFWRWLQATDDPASLVPLHSFLNVFDRKLLALIFMRYVRATILEHQSEAPPEPNCYTPDNGFTWISIELEDADKFRMLGRLLAYIFQTNAELFYQLISLPMTTTTIELEEEAFQEKDRRLMDEGIPGHAHAAETNSAMAEQTAKDLLRANPSAVTIEARRNIAPVIYSGTGLQPLSSLIAELQASPDKTPFENFEAELSLLANAAITYFGVPLNEGHDVQFLLSQVRGALNIGIERALTLEPLGLPEIYERLSAQGIYRLGLGELKRLVSKARLVSNNNSKTDLGALETAVLEAAQSFLPEFPGAFLDAKVDEPHDARRNITRKPFEHLSEVVAIEEYLKDTFGS